MKIHIWYPLTAALLFFADSSVACGLTNLRKAKHLDEPHEGVENGDDHHHHVEHAPHGNASLGRQLHDGLQRDGGWSCGAPKMTMEEKMESMRIVEEYVETHGRKLSGSTVVVPTYWFVIQNTAGTGYLSSTQISNNMDILNAAFEGEGFKFQLMDTQYFTNNDWFENDNQDAYKAAIRPSTATAGDLLIYTTTAGGNAGYAYYPYPGSNTFFKDGVVLHHIYGIDKTLPHEVGHWLKLAHTFNDNTCNGDGDGVDDTPVQYSASSGCPTGRDSCPNHPGVDPIHNYMDYTSDGCKTEFTPGQYVRMRAAWEAYRAPYHTPPGGDDDDDDDDNGGSGGLVQSGWTSYANEFDAFFYSDFDAPSGQTAAICGLSSYHSNSYQDRRFRFKYCYPKKTSEQNTVITASSGWSDFDTWFYYNCPEGSFISRITSFHSNSHEDRRFQYNCHKFVDHELSSCYTTEWVNSYNGEFDFTAEQGYVINGFESIHENQYEDRGFKFRVCKVDYSSTPGTCEPRLIDNNKKCPYGSSERAFRVGGSGDIYNVETCNQACLDDSTCKYFSLGGSDSGSFEGVCIGCVSPANPPDSPQYVQDGFDYYEAVDPSCT